MLTIIGDVDQMLYRFNGAKPEIMATELPHFFPNLLTFKMGINYRSTKTIVEAQKRLIAYNYGALGGSYPQELFKDLEAKPDAKEGQSITFHEYLTPDEEATAVADEIATLIESGEYQPGDFFVGARTKNQLGYLEGPLVRARVKFVNIAGGSFWASKHVVDVLSYVKLAVNHSDKEAFKRVYNIASRWFTRPWGKRRGEYSHRRYLGNAFLAAVDSSYTEVWRAEREYSKKGVADLKEFMRELEYTLEGDGISAAIEFVVENCYEKYLATEEGLMDTDEAQNGKMEDLKTVIEIAAGFADAEAFFAYVAELQQAAIDAKNGEQDEYVVLSTVHRLKGRERKVVFGIGFSEGYMRRKEGEEVPVGLLPHTFSLSAPPQFGVLPTGGGGSVADERCIAFVLVSRAMERCYLSSIQTYRKGWVLSPSRFIRELGLIEGEKE